MVPSDVRASSMLSYVTSGARADSSFSIVDKFYFRYFIGYLCPKFKIPSLYMLSGNMMYTESVQVHMLETAQLKECKLLTILTDGWGDVLPLQQSLCGTVASKTNQYPAVLDLTDMTGQL